MAHASCQYGVHFLNRTLNFSGLARKHYYAMLHREYVHNRVMDTRARRGMLMCKRCCIVLRADMCGVDTNAMVHELWGCHQKHNNYSL
jgi:hypothetical protein